MLVWVVSASIMSAVQVLCRKALLERLHGSFQAKARTVCGVNQLSKYIVPTSKARAHVCIMCEPALPCHHDCTVYICLKPSSSLYAAFKQLSAAAGRLVFAKLSGGQQQGWHLVGCPCQILSQACTTEEWSDTGV